MVHDTPALAHASNAPLAVPAEETRAAETPVRLPWKIAIVDDDRSVHAVTRLVLADYAYKGRPVKILSEYSAQGAERMLCAESDVAVVLLDVVMETDHAGLDLVRYIRRNLGNSLARIILRTGQPGRAPEHEVITRYDINDYKEKSDLTAQKLLTSVTAALRAYDDLLTIQDLSNSKESLERMVGERTRALQWTTETLRRSQGLLAEAQRIAGVGHFEWDLVGGEMTWSDELRRMLRVAPSPETRPSLAALLSAAAPEERDALNGAISAALTARRSYALEHRIVRGDGSEGHVRQQGEVHCDAHGAPVRLVGIVQDITERRRAEDAMRKLSTALEQTADSVMITGRDGIIEYVNTAFTAITGYARDEAIGQTPRLLKSGHHGTAYYQRLWESLLRGEVVSDVVVNRRKNGTTYHESQTITPQRDPSGAIARFVATGRDVTEAMRARERIEYLAHHDALTGLPNRMLLMDRLHQALARAKWRQRHVAVAFLDLDRFKVINDTLGHDFGDGVLKEVGARLLGCVREGDTVARLGGDEFAIILNDVADQDDVAILADKVIGAMKVPLRVLGREFFATPSIGISMFPRDGDDGAMLLKRADLAMYSAKARGRNNYQFYAEHDESNAIARLDLETDLRRALAQNEFFLTYQPQVDTATGRTVGAEALLRWQHPDGRVVPPLDFVPLLEETGMIVEVGAWVLEQACSDARWLHEHGLPRCRVAVNISLHQFRRPDFIDRVAAVLAKTGLAPQLLELELTEGVLIDDIQGTTESLNRLHAMGVRLAIDDFGTGYSSMHYLGRLPFDAMKIDRSLLGDAPQQRDSAAVVTAIVSLARAMRLEAIAEGVSTEEQVRFLKDLGCHLVQGYVLSPPLLAGDLATFVRDSGDSARPAPAQ